MKLLYEPVLIALSLFGAWAVTSPSCAVYGFAAWVVSNAGWVIHFTRKKEPWPCLLFVMYWLLAIKGVLRW